jgi:hypothetical protein
MNRSTRSSIGGPRIKSLAAALSLAIASVSLGAASNNLTPIKFQNLGTPNGKHDQFNAVKSAKRLDFHRFRSAVQKEFGSLPASRPPSRAPMTVHVVNHADSGSGSLREVLNNAVDGDVIDLSSLHGTLTLTSPLIPAAGVTIKGPGRDVLTIDANHVGRAMTSAHSLKLSNVTIANGATPATSTPAGGCLFVNGGVQLTNVNLSNCTADGGAGNYAYGGALAVNGSLSIDSSTLTNNSVTASNYGLGGAVAVYGTPTQYGVSITNSTLSGNSVTAGDSVAGGGIGAFYKSVNNNVASVTLSNTTVSSNTLTATSIPPYYNATYQKYYYYGTASGGGVFTVGANTTVTGSHIDNNTQTSNSSGLGGGLYVRYGTYYNPVSTTTYAVGGAASVTSSTISGNSSSSVYRFSYGGGMSTTGDITIAKSVLADNKIQSGCATKCFNAGGAVIGGTFTYDMSITDSTFSGNSVTATSATAYTSGGAISTRYANYGTALTITNSTISGNSTATGNTGLASTYAAGVYQQVTSSTASMTVNNSTIAFNSSRDFGAGIATAGSLPLTLNSSIVSNNTSTTYAVVSDVAPRAPTFVVAGDYSLVQTDPSSYGVTFSGTHDIIGSDPLLLPLANNGGTTQTHALDPTSPAIDKGSNTLSLPFDQRGTPYPRVVGAAADIGAYELDTDHIFGNGFE